MPTYEYRCLSCNQEHHQFQKISDSPLTECPFCKKHALKRGPGGGFAVSFQGTGFYSTDYQKQPIPSDSSEKKNCCPCDKHKPC